MTTRRLTKYEDPSHGWLAVPASLVIELGLTDKITSYSYMGENPAAGTTEYMVFLEEDCDMHKLLAALSDHGNHPVIAYVHSDMPSFVRSLEGYDPIVLKQRMQSAMVC